MTMKHLALLVPNTDTTLETDLRCGLPADWTYHSSRMHLDEVGEQAERDMVDKELPKGLASFRGIIPFSAAVFGCTSASAVYGRKGAQQLKETMQESLHCPAASAFSCVEEAIYGAGNPPMAFLSPYIDSVNTFFAGTLREFGIHPVCYQGMGIVQDPEIAAIAPEQTLSFVRSQKEKIHQAGAKLVFLSCTNWRVYEQKAALEAILELPVITSNSCILDWIRSLDGQAPQANEPPVPASR
jgi:maleate isomerase